MSCQRQPGLPRGSHPSWPLIHETVSGKVRISHLLKSGQWECVFDQKRCWSGEDGGQRQALCSAPSITVEPREYGRPDAISSAPRLLHLWSWAWRYANMAGRRTIFLKRPQFCGIENVRRVDNGWSLNWSPCHLRYKRGSKLHQPKLTSLPRWSPL